MGIKITKTPFERAAPAGQELVRKMKEDRTYRKNWADKEIGQAAKEAATHLAGIARGRVSVMLDPNDWERIFRKRGKNA